MSSSRNSSICRYFLHHPQISPIIRVGEVPGSNPGAPTQKTQQMLGFLLGERSGAIGHGLVTNARLHGFATPRSGCEQGFEWWRAPAATVRSRTRVPPVDLLIAETAERAATPLIHYDRDYDRIAAVTAQPHLWLVADGALAKEPRVHSTSAPRRPPCRCRSAARLPTVERFSAACDGGVERA